MREEFMGLAQDFLQGVSSQADAIDRGSPAQQAAPPWQAQFASSDLDTGGQVHVKIHQARTGTLLLDAHASTLRPERI
jgi:hypothetical protein